MAETCFDLLLIEMLQFYGSEQPQGRGALGENTSTSSGAENGTNGAGSGAGVGGGGPAAAVKTGEGLESMGFQVGCQLGERYSKHRARFDDTLDTVKFLCKEFWTEVFRKQIDNLKTNHRGVFVLYDSKFRWLRLASVEKGQKGQKSTADLLRFPCGLIRGALFTLGIKAAVSADVASALPACSFTVKITQQQQPTAAAK